MSFFLGPIRTFFDLRKEAKRRMIIYWHAPNSDARLKSLAEGIDDVEIYKWDEGRLQLEDIGAQIASFDRSEFLVGWVLRRIGFDLAEAGRAFRDMAMSLGTTEEDRDRNFSRADKALKFRIDRSKVFYSP